MWNNPQSRTVSNRSPREANSSAFHTRNLAFRPRSLALASAAAIAAAAAHVQDLAPERSILRQMEERRLGPADVPRWRTRVEGVEVLRTPGPHATGRAVAFEALGHAPVRRGGNSVGSPSASTWNRS